MKIDRKSAFAKSNAFALTNDVLGRDDIIRALPARTGSGLRNSFPDRTVYARFGKRALDITLVVLSAPITLPVVLLAALALWVESGLPFYSQDRRGQSGKSFSILKLRTMVRDADALLARLLEEDEELRNEWTTTQKLKKDPRITKVGKILRATSLDELPQLWNVLKGDMSLVGPRPMLVNQAEMYGATGHYDAVRPGLTGPWQVSSRNESEFADRVGFDAAYRQAVSLRTDVSLLFKTVGVVLRQTGY